MQRVLLINIILLNVALFISTLIFGMTEGDAGMGLVVTFPHWILFNLVNLFLVGFTLSIDNKKTKVLILFTTCALSFSYLIIEKVQLAILLEIWISLIFFIDLWTFVSNQEN